MCPRPTIPPSRVSPASQKSPIIETHEKNKPVLIIDARPRY
jgi:hypothetical protein